MKNPLIQAPMFLIDGDDFPRLILRLGHEHLSTARRVAVACLGDQILPQLLASPEPDLDDLLRVVQTHVKSRPNVYKVQHQTPLHFYPHPSVPLAAVKVEFDMSDLLDSQPELLRALSLNMNVPAQHIERFEQLMLTLDDLLAAAQIVDKPLFGLIEATGEDWRVVMMMRIALNCDEENVRSAALEIFKSNALITVPEHRYYELARRQLCQT